MRRLATRTKTHYLYETDAGHHRTLCGVLTREGDIGHQAVVTCVKCRQSFKQHCLVKDRAQDVTPHRPTPTVRGSKKRVRSS